MMMKDVVLEWEVAGRDYQPDVQVILPNIRGQRYLFGSEYPGGEREGEEFIFIRKEGVLVDSTHFVIRVDELGYFWIQNVTTKFKTFVNSERLFLEPRLLKIGDVVLLEESEIRCGFPNRRHLIFYVEERIVPGSGLEIEGAGSGSDSEGCRAMKELDLDECGESPLDDPLILEKIMNYLPVKDLRNSRLVSKKWKEEASRPLENRGKVSFTFSGDYLNPENSTRVFRYLHEMRDLKMKNLHISLSYSYSPGGPGQKVMDDLRKLLNSSHSFSSLLLHANIEEESGFPPFSLLFQELGEKLVELELRNCQLLLPTVLPTLPVMRNLKKFTGERFGGVEPRWWVSHFVPLFSNSLEHFTCWRDTADPYLEEFLKHPTPNLKGITLTDEASETSLKSLLDLETPLAFLEIQFSNSKSSTEPKEMLDSLLLKHSKSLQRLVLRIRNWYYPYEYTEIKFPPFPKLVELELEYERGTRIGWGHENSLDYEDHFPSLRKLTVRPLDPWREDDHVFNVFFRRRELTCETVNELWVPVLEKSQFPCYWSNRALESFRPRMDQIRKMFPNAEKMNFFQ